jgi:hypothetical protein
MKRRHVESEANGVSVLLRDIELGADALLAQRKRGESPEAQTHVAVMGALMALRRKEQEGAAAVAQAAGPDGQEEEDERVRKQLEDVTALNRELEERIVAEADTDGKREGSVEQLYELLAQARQLEKTLASMRAQRLQLTAQKRDLAGQLALVTGNTPQLDKETKVRDLCKRAIRSFSHLLSPSNRCWDDTFIYWTPPRSWRHSRTKQRSPLRFLCCSRHCW